MRKLLLLVFLFAFAAARGQDYRTDIVVLDSVSKIASYYGGSKVIFVKDTSLGGYFYLYQGGVAADGKDVITGANSSKWRRSLTSPVDFSVVQVPSYTALRTMPRVFANKTYVVYANGINNLFRYDATDNSSSDDSAVVIVGYGGARYKRVIESRIDARWFNVIPYDNVDDSYGFQKMFNYVDTVTNLKEYNIFITGGKYNVSSTINLPQAISNVGSGSIPRLNIEGNGVTIFITGAITGFKRAVANITDANTSIGNYTITMSGIEFVGDQTTGQKGMELHALYGAEIKNMRFTTLDTGLVARFILGSRFDNLFYTNNKSVGLLGGSLSGVATSATTSNSAFNANLVTKNRVFCASGSYAAMMFLAADGCDYKDNIIEGSKPRYSFYSDAQSTSVVNGNHIDGMWFEANGGTYAYNVSIKLSVNGVFTINKVQNDYADTLIDWSNTAPGATIKIDNIEYWNFPDKPFKGTPASGMAFYIGQVYGAANNENLFKSSAYADGQPQDVFPMYPQQMNSGAGMGLVSNTVWTIKPNFNAAYGNRYMYLRGNFLPDTTDTYTIGSGLNKWNYGYFKKGLFNLASEDGSGYPLQVGGGVSISDGSYLNSPNYGRIGFTSGYTIIERYNSQWYSFKINSGFYWSFGGTDKMSLTSNGLAMNGTPTGNSVDTKILVKGAADSVVKQRTITDIVATFISHGTYTPTTYIVSNLDSVKAFQCTYQKVDSFVYVYGEITVDPTANNADTRVDLSLPVFSTLSSTYSLAGNGSSYTIGDALRIYANTSNNRAILRFKTSDNGAHTFTFNFQYKIIGPL